MADDDQDADPEEHKTLEEGVALLLDTDSKTASEWAHVNLTQSPEGQNEAQLEIISGSSSYTLVGLNSGNLDMLARFITDFSRRLKLWTKDTPTED